MRSFHRILAALVAGLLCLCSAQATRADLLVNGDFELGPTIPSLSPVMSVAPGNTSLTGWSVVSGAIDIVTDNYWVPVSGHRSVALSTTGPGAIEQTFSTATGAVYRLTYWISGEPFSSPTIKHLRVTAGAATQDQTFDTTPAWEWDMAWSRRTFDFTATGSSTTLRFASMDATQWGPAIDSARVELVTAGVDGGTSALAFAPVSPDPVRTTGRIAFTLASAGHVKLAVHDIQGRQVALLADADLDAGPHGVEFSPRTWNARPGLYLATLEAGGHTLVRRFSVIP
jgi:choice-of-anchor C domain-containing protein